MSGLKNIRAWVRRKIIVARLELEVLKSRFSRSYPPPTPLEVDIFTGWVQSIEFPGVPPTQEEIYLREKYAHRKRNPQ